MGLSFAQKALFLGVNSGWFGLCSSDSPGMGADSGIEKEMGNLWLSIGFREENENTGIAGGQTLKDKDSFWIAYLELRNFPQLFTALRAGSSFQEIIIHRDSFPCTGF